MSYCQYLRHTPSLAPLQGWTLVLMEGSFERQQDPAATTAVYLWEQAVPQGSQSKPQDTKQRLVGSQIQT